MGVLTARQQGAGIARGKDKWERVDSPDSSDFFFNGRVGFK